MLYGCGHDVLFSRVVELFIECVLVDHLVIIITPFVCLPLFVFLLCCAGVGVFERGVRLGVHLLDALLPVPSLCSIFFKC